MRAIRAIIEQGTDRLLHELGDLIGKFSEFLSIVIFMMTVGCTHSRMGRPLTVDGVTYRTCADCGARRLFDLSTWRMYGTYFYRLSQGDLETSTSGVANRLALAGQLVGQELKQAA